MTVLTTCCNGECVEQLTALQTDIEKLSCCYILPPLAEYTVLDLSSAFTHNNVLLSFKVCEGDAVLLYRTTDSIFDEELEEIRYQRFDTPCRLEDFFNVKEIKIVNLDKARTAKVIVRFTLFTEVTVNCGCCPTC